MQRYSNLRDGTQPHTPNCCIDKSTSSSKNGNRCLVDYTQYRSDGTKSPSYNDNTSRRNLPNKNDLAMASRNIMATGMPACRALEATLIDVVLAIDNSPDERERIDFFLKVAPKSQRKQQKRRVSTLDIVGARTEMLRQITVSSTKEEEPIPRHSNRSNTSQGPPNMRYGSRRIAKRSASSVSSSFSPGKLASRTRRKSIETL